MLRTRRLLGTLAILTVCLSLAGCGGSDSPRGPRGGGPYEVDTTPPSGGGPPGPPPPAEITYRVLSAAGATGILTQQHRVARDETEFIALWNEHQSWWKPGIGAPIVGPPPVDFDTEIVVAVFLGLRPTSGYSVAVLSVEAEGDGARVVYEERQPGQGCAVVQTVTWPFLFAAITRVEGEIAFDGAVRVVDCP